MFKQSGVIKVTCFEELTDCILGFTWLPLPRGRKVAIVSGMGGTCVGASDNCILAGLEMARLSQGTIDRLAKILPPVGTSISNPLDIGVASLLTPQLYGDATRILAEDEGVDMIMAITAPDNPRSIKSLAQAAPSVKKPLVATLFEIAGLVEPEMKGLLAQNIPAYYEPKRATTVLARMAEYAEYKNQA
jgi:acyl-CoA synthetase (NDP forming)